MILIPKALLKDSVPDLRGGNAQRVHPSFVRNQDFIKSKFCRAGILPALGQPRRLSTFN